MSLWCSAQGVACTCRKIGFDSRRRCFPFLCTVLIYFFLFSLCFSFWPVFLYSYCSPCWSCTWIRSFILEKGFQVFLICTLAKLTARKTTNDKLWSHVPSPLKQLNSVFSVLVDTTTNNTQYTTNCTSLHPTPTSDQDALAKFKLAFCTSA